MVIYTTGTDDLEAAEMWRAILRRDADGILLLLGQPALVPDGLARMREFDP